MKGLILIRLIYHTFRYVILICGVYVKQMKKK